MIQLATALPLRCAYASAAEQLFDPAQALISQAFRPAPWSGQDDRTPLTPGYYY
jgi:hypothetical protein